MLTTAQRADFEALGFVRFPAFTAAEAVVMQDAVWGELARVHDVRRDDVGSWRAGPVFGLQRLPELPAFAPIGGAAMRAAIDDLLGAGSWDAPRRWGAFLVTFPQKRRAWTVPDRVWHADFPFDLPALPIPGVKVFAFVSDVGPGMGGTLVVSGSHHVVRNAGLPADVLRDTRRARLRILDAHPWLRELCSPADGEDRVRRFMEAPAGDGLRVVELTGSAGDVVLTHPWLLHCPAPNCGTSPRFMRSQDVYRRELHPRVFQTRTGMA